jgi:glutathione peroxidase
MTGKQQIMKWLYPLIKGLSKAGGKARVLANAAGKQPSTSIFDFELELNNGKRLSLRSLKGKKLLIVNTASDCGYTGQYDELQQLHQQYGDKVVIIGFPANDFKEQEKGSDEDIAQFCRLNYGVTFPLTRKTSVVNGANQHPLYQWLSHANRNGWNDQPPAWNFSKYLVNEAGALTHYFDAGVSPMSPQVLKVINE